MVDDFAGSGEQFIKTWSRMYQMSDGSQASFESMASLAGADVYYIPTVATEHAVRRIQLAAPSVRLRTAHLLTDHYSAVDPHSVVFPDALRPEARDFVARTSAQAGIPSSMELGWDDLALALAFEHSVPDATLPILWADTPTWNSLLRRS